MKKLPRTRVVVPLLVLAIIALLAGQGCVSVLPSFGNFMQGLYGLVVNGRPITSKLQFEKALSEVQHAGVSYRFQLDYNAPYAYGPDVVIQIDKTVVTQLGATRDGSHPHGPNLTHHIYSVDSKDITRVSKEIKSQ